MKAFGVRTFVSRAPPLFIHLLIGSFNSKAELLQNNPRALPLVSLILHAAVDHSKEISERDKFSSHIAYQPPDPKPLSSLKILNFLTFIPCIFFSMFTNDQK
jgi:hypothetical protein